MRLEGKNLDIATFRFGVISDFVTGVKLTYGEKEKLIKNKVSRSYKIPHSNRTTVSRSSIIAWMTAYRSAGYRLEGLIPRSRNDKGVFRNLDPTIRLAVKELKKENPSLTVPTMIKKLRQNKEINIGETVNPSSIYRYLKTEKLISTNDDAEDRRRFEAEYPNECWQSDVMHGPHVQFEKGKKKKTYLCAIIDDHSRLITHAEFYFNEDLDTLKSCLRKAIEKRGLPQKLYVDNGACYRAINLEQITAILGISLAHARPYKPQGKGKIERWFKNIRASFIPCLHDRLNLRSLNEALDSWVDDYNNSIHSSTKETPYSRYKSNLECVRPAPPNLIDYFRSIEFRRVKKDRTVQLNGSHYEAPVALIDRKIELRYHAQDPHKVEMFFNHQSFGFATVLSASVNAKVGRSWRRSSDCKNHSNETLVDEKIKTGLLFKGDSNEQIY